MTAEARRAVHVAFQRVLQQRARRFETELHLVQNKLGLALDQNFFDLAGVRIDGGNPET